MKRSKSGSVIAATLLIAVALTVVLAGILQWVNTESRVSRGSLLTAKARYGAESSAEFALAQMRATLERQPMLTTNMFTASGTPPARPDATILSTNTATVLQDLGATTDGGTGTRTYTRLGNVIGAVTSLLDGSSSTTSSGGSSSSSSTTSASADPFDLQSVTLAVSPLGTEYRLAIDRNNPLYASDPLRGHTVRVREVNVYSAARATDAIRGENAMSYCITTLQIRTASLFDNAAFYNLDLELSPAAGMEVFGPIHCNRNIYVQGGGSGTETVFHGVVTAAGGIYHGRAPGVSLSTNPGDVSFARADGVLVDMKQGSDWLDSRDSDWAGAAQSRWGGNVLTGAHGIVPSLPSPIPVDDPETAIEDLSNAARVLIEPAMPDPEHPEMEMLKYSANASLVFEITTTTTTTLVDLLPVTVTTLTPRAFRYVRDDANGEYVRRDGDDVHRFRREELTVPSGLWNYNEFYDRRWDKTVASADLDVGRLKQLIEDSSHADEWSRGSVEFNPQTDWNGVVYIEQKNTTNAAVRVVNGEEVPSLPTTANQETRGFTLATNAPLYVWGNYNADGSLPANAQDIQQPDSSSEPPAALVADAVTVLSNSWSDDNSTKGISYRQASQTEVAAAIVGGIVPSTNGEYSGGWHNMVRMLEDWRGVKLAFRSSMVVLYTSQIADAPWAGQSPVYEPPSRLFGLNSLFQEGETPPGPVRTEMRRLRSRIVTADEFNAAMAANGVTP